MADDHGRPSPRLRAVGWGDTAFRVILTAFAATIPLLFVALVARLTVSAWPTIRAFGVRFLTTSTWDPVANVYGAAPMIFGTLFSSLIALLLAVPLALGVAIYLTEFAPRWLRGPVGTLVELLAAIPSVVYGLWGIFFLLPILREKVMPFLAVTLGLGRTPFFSGPAYGNSMLAAAIFARDALVDLVADDREVADDEHLDRLRLL